MVKFGGQNKMFYKPKRNAIDFKDERLTKIKTRTEDGVELGGFLIQPKNKDHMSEVTLVYMHGISLEPQERITELLATSEALNC